MSKSLETFSSNPLATASTIGGSMSISQIMSIIAEAIAAGYEWLHPHSGQRDARYAMVLVARYNQRRLRPRMVEHARRMAGEFQTERAAVRVVQGVDLIDQDLVSEAVDILGAANTHAQRAMVAQRAERAAELAEHEAAAAEGISRAEYMLNQSLRLGMDSLSDLRPALAAERAAAEATPRTKAAELAERAAAAEAAAAEAEAAADAALRLSVALRTEAADADADAWAWEQKAGDRERAAELAAAEAAAKAAELAERVKAEAEVKAAAEAVRAAEAASQKDRAERANRDKMTGPLSILDLARAHGAKRAQIMLSEPGQTEVRLRAFDPTAKGGAWLLQQFPSLVDGGALLGGKVKGRAHAVLTPDGDIRLTRRYSSRAAELAIDALNRFALDPERRGAELGRLHGSCVFCRLPLSDPRSTTAGYGPICAGHYRLTWGDRPGQTLEDRKAVYVSTLAERRATRAAERLSDAQAEAAADDQRDADLNAQADALEAELASFKVDRSTIEDQRATARRAEDQRKAAAQADALAGGEASAAELRAAGDIGAARFKGLQID